MAELLPMLNIAGISRGNVLIAVELRSRLAIFLVRLDIAGH